MARAFGPLSRSSTAAGAELIEASKKTVNFALNRQRSLPAALFRSPQQFEKFHQVIRRLYIGLGKIGSQLFDVRLELFRYSFSVSLGQCVKHHSGMSLLL